MALPLVPIALGGAAAFILYLTSTGDTPAGPGGTTPSLPLGSGPAPSGAQGGAMPAQLRAAYEDLLRNGKDPAAMEAAANELQKFGFVAEANALRARAAQLRAQAPSPSAPAAPAYVPPAAPAYVPPAAPAPSFPGLPVTPPPAPSLTATVTTKDQPLAIRSQPIDGSAPVGSAPPGAKVTVLNPIAGLPTAAAPMGWAQIQYGQVVGFSSNQYLSGLGGGGSAPAPASPPSTSVVTATATTAVNTRTGPGVNYPLVAKNDAWQGTTVRVLNWNAAPADGAAPMGWAQIVTPGGSTGFASKQYLQLAPSVSGVAIGASGGSVLRCAAPRGCKLRVTSNLAAPHLAVIGRGEAVRLLAHAPGTKAEAVSPGPGGWAKVAYGARVGWVPSEWFLGA